MEADAYASTAEPPQATAPVTATERAVGSVPPPMAGEEAEVVPGPDHKRKLGEAEVEEEGAAADRAEVGGKGGEEEEAAAETEHKRPRMDGEGDGSGITQTEVHETVTAEVVNEEVLVNECILSSSEVNVPKECSQLPQEDDVPSSEQQSAVAFAQETAPHKIEIPQSKVGVLVGDSGETIRCPQITSDANIEIARYDEADINSSSGPIELTGPLENINKAEQLIKDIIPQVDAGDSSTLPAKKFDTPQSGAGQVDIHVPSEKAGLVIGKGGETIKALKTKSGADIQFIPQHLPEGDLSTERKVRLTGNWNQIEVARTMILELISQMAGHEPDRVPQWGSNKGHDYLGRGMYYQNPQSSWNQMSGSGTGQAPYQDGRNDYYVSYNTYSASGLNGVQAPMYYSTGGHSSVQAPMYYSSGGHSGVQAPMYYSAVGHSGVQAPMYYSARGCSGVQAPVNHSARGPSGVQAPIHYRSWSPQVPVGYSSYPHSAPVQLSYEQGHNGQYYGQQSLNSQPGYQSYPPQQYPYGKFASRGVQQGYAPVPTQPGATTYQGPTPAQQPYAVQGSTVPPQQGLGYGQPSGTITGATDGYAQCSRGYQQPASQVASTYPQQAMQPAVYWQYPSTQPGYTNQAVANNANYQQSASQVAPAYPQQVMQPAAYWQYPSTQPGYSNQTVANNANYQQPASHVASTYPQQGMQPSVYGQYPLTQPGYTDQTVANSANYQQPTSHAASAYPQQGMQSHVYGQYPSTQTGYTDQTVTNNANCQQPVSHVASAYPQQGVQPGVYGQYPSTQPGYTDQAGYIGGSTGAITYCNNQSAAGHGSVPEGNAVNQAQGGA